MQPIEFRAWDKKTNRMIQPTDICRLHFNKGIPYGILTWNEQMILKFDLMQFTGLLDKNGKKIFENDFLKSRSSKIVLVEWSGHGFFTERLPVSAWELSEVIGNIYENPELLEAK